jgi:transcriptional regulator
MLAYLSEQGVSTAIAYARRLFAISSHEAPMSGSDLFTGTLDLLILRSLHAGPQHGYAIGRWIRERSSGVLDVEEGALYPALHRLERRGLLRARWGRTDTGRRAKFYETTPEGARRLAAESERWSEFSSAVHAVLDGGT